MADHYNLDSDEEFSLPYKGKENPFAVPGNYFDSLAARIVERIEFNAELEEYSVLKEIRKGDMFAAPEDYFRKVAEVMEYQQELSEFTELEKASQKKPEFAEQDEYFETTQIKIEKGIELAGELQQYEFLYQLEKKNNFAVDPEYFETIADKVKERKYAESQGSSVLGNFLQLWFKPKAVLAYSLIFLAGAGVLWFNYHSSPAIDPSGDCKTLACLEKKEVLNEQTLNDFNEEDLYDMVDADELDKKLSGDSETADSIILIKQSDSIK
jgi:hypothetical protein